MQLTKDVAAAAPKVKIFTGDGDETATYFDPKQGGIPTSLDARIFMTKSL